MNIRSLWFNHLGSSDLNLRILRFGGGDGAEAAQSVSQNCYMSGAWRYLKGNLKWLLLLCCCARCALCIKNLMTQSVVSYFNGFLYCSHLYSLLSFKQRQKSNLLILLSSGMHRIDGGLINSILELPAHNGERVASIQSVTQRGGPTIGVQSSWPCCPYWSGSRERV